MKIISIGDIHGRDYWKEIDPTKYDKIIFVGDYVDQFPPMKDQEIMTNLLEIITLKKTYPDKVELLLGNHDLQYMFLGQFGCSGFRPSQAQALQILFNTNKDIFKVAYQLGEYLWTHAGVSNGWYNKNRKIIMSYAKEFDCKNEADTFNVMLWTKDNGILHQVSRSRGGSYEFGGITWADRTETHNDYVQGLHQIVGHTPTMQITKFGDEKGSIRYIDVFNEEFFQRERIKAVKNKTTKNSKYDDKIKELFPDFTSPLKEELPITKFYEFEIEHIV